MGEDEERVREEMVGERRKDTINRTDELSTGVRVTEEKGMISLHTHREGGRPDKYK